MMSNLIAGSSLFMLSVCVHKLGLRTGTIVRRNVSLPTEGSALLKTNVPPVKSLVYTRTGDKGTSSVSIVFCLFISPMLNCIFDSCCNINNIAI